MFWWVGLFLVYLFFGEFNIAGLDLRGNIEVLIFGIISIAISIFFFGHFSDGEKQERKKVIKRRKDLGYDEVFTESEGGESKYSQKLNINKDSVNTKQSKTKEIYNAGQIASEENIQNENQHFTVKKGSGSGLIGLVLAGLMGGSFVYFIERNPSVEDVGHITDQLELARIVVNEKDRNVRKAAVGRLTNQAVLAGVTIEDKDSHIRKTAAKKLTDQAALTKVAIEAKDEDVRKAAFEKLTDETALTKVAIEAEDEDVRKAAIEKLTDQTVLTKIAINTSSKRATQKLTDQAALARVAIEAKDTRVREIAVRTLTDQAALAKVAIESEDEYIRYTAMKKLTDQEVLIRVSRKAKDND